MAYVTQLNGALIEIGANLDPIIKLPPHFVLNSFGPSKEISEYRVQNDGSPGTLNRGDFLTVFADEAQAARAASSGADGKVTGTYLGTGTISNAGLRLGDTANTLLNLGISVTVNPINGYYLAGDDGSVNFISDQEFSANRILATLTVKLPLLNPVTVTVPVSQLTSELASLDPTGLLNTLLGGALDLSQTIMDTAIVTPSQPANVPTNLPDFEVVCFVRGTMIDTEFGPIAVDNLRVGMNVVTRDHGLQPIRWIGSKGVRLGAQSKIAPIRIAAGALGRNVPDRDLLVSPQHRILVRSKIAQTMFGCAEILVPVKQLLQVDGIDIATELAEVEYFHFLFDRHEVVIANGAETESLFTGPEALKAVGPAARREVLELFPQLAELDYLPEPARPLPTGRQARKLAMRHIQKNRELVM